MKNVDNGGTCGLTTPAEGNCQPGLMCPTEDRIGDSGDLCQGESFCCSSTPPATLTQS